MSLVCHPHLQGVCVAGYGQSGGNEILQLLPPPTLQAKETQVGVAARVTPGLSVLLNLVSSETGLLCAGLPTLLPGLCCSEKGSAGF